MRQYKYSEIFSKAGTIQGEGRYMGVHTIWLRFWGCNLTCAGFGQKNPKDPTTWEKPYDAVKISEYETVEDLPVFEYGCDSVYSHNPDFNKFVQKNTAKEICDKLEECLPNGRFYNQKTRQTVHLAFTGGEPLLNQSAIIDIVSEFVERNNVPKFITIETNGTIPLRENFKKFMSLKAIKNNIEFFFSISPKLTASGELRNKAINLDVLQSYHKHSTEAQLKFVVDGTEEVWKEIDNIVSELYEKASLDISTMYKPIHIYIMPVGATREQQELIQADICEQSCKRGYNFSPRIHNWIFDNVVGK